MQPLPLRLLSKKLNEPDGCTAVAAGVLDAEEVATATSLIWDHVEARSAAAYPDRPVSRGDPASWGGKGLWGSGGEGDGYGLLVDQHCAGMWYVRGLPRVHEMWTALHGGESSLAVSFDGAQLWRPWDVNPEWHAQDVTGFLHIDRRPFPAPTPAEAATAAAGWSPWRRAMGSSAFCRYGEDGACHGRIGTGYVQGFVSLIETTEAMVNATACERLLAVPALLTPRGCVQGGNCVVRGSHARYDELVERCIALAGEDRAAVSQDPGWRPDYTQLLQQDQALADSVVMCKLHPGDHMLWDDRAIHGNARGRGPSPRGDSLARASVFISMSPMALLDEETRECRREMARLGLGAGHSSHHKLAPGSL